MQKHDWKAKFGETYSHFIPKRARSREALMIRVFTLCLVGTATVASADGYGFRTPTGNIYCNGAVTTSEMICSIVERHGPPAQPNTGACPEVWGHHVQLGGTGPARVICAKRPSRSYYSDVAEYGLSASFGNITCRSERTGLQCTNPEGHGFFLSRREQRILSSSTQDWSRPTRSEIREAQELLARLGYDPGVPDGVTGPNTARAVSAFQRDSGAQQTGAITNALITSLQGAVDGLIESGEHATEKSAEGPSFDCARAGTPTERAICASPELARLDRHMAEAFAQAFAGASDPEHVRADQRAWLQTRDGCGAEVICLKDVMSTRIAEWTGHVETERDQPHNDAIASETLENLVRFDRDVYLLRFAESEGGIVHFSPLNFEDLGPEALAGAVEGAIGTRPTFARLRALSTPE